MKKLGILLAIAVVGAVLWLATRTTAKRSAAALASVSPSEQLASDPEPYGEAEREPATALARAEGHAPDTGPVNGTVAGDTTNAERAVLTMYDEMLNAFVVHRESCRDAGIAIETLIESHKASLEQLRDERAGLSPEQWTAAQARLMTSQGDRMERARAQIEQIVARCKDNARLRNALRSLAAASAPEEDSSAQ